MRHLPSRAAAIDNVADATRRETAFDFLLQIGRDAIEARVPSDVAARGAAYARRGAVTSLQESGDLIQATVAGSEPEPYRTVIRVAGSGGIDALCTCPYDRGWCKHVVATIMLVLEPQAVSARSPRRAKIPTSRNSVIPAALPPPPRVAARRRRMQKMPAVDAQQVRKNVPRTLHSLDHLRPSEAYWRVGDVTHKLERVRAEAEARFASGVVPAAFEQLGVLTDEMCGAWEVLDDSDGLVGDLAREIGGTWVRWLLHPDVQPLLRRRYVASLERWLKAYDSYGVGEQFAAAVFAGRHGWGGDGPSELVAAKLDILEQRGDAENFLALALRAGEVRQYALCQIKRGDIDAALTGFERLTFDAQDALAVAEALLDAGQIERALSFALGIARRSAPLVSEHAWSDFDGRLLIANWVAENAERHGDAATALAGAKIGFGLEVDVEHYRRIKRLSGEGWSSIREDLLECVCACKPREVDAAVDVLLDEEHIETAQRLFDGRSGRLGEKTLWRLFVRAAEASPEWAAERAIRFAVEIMDRAERSRYERAARWLRIAAFAFRNGGRHDAWATHRAGLLAKHRAKRALIPLIVAIG